MHSKGRGIAGGSKRQQVNVVNKKNVIFCAHHILNIDAITRKSSK